MIKTIRYPRYNTPNPSVTCFVVNLNVLKYINLIPLVLPDFIGDDFYIGNMFWISNNELTLTYTSRDQTLSSTFLCKAPLFDCIEVSRICINLLLYHLGFSQCFRHARKFSMMYEKSSTSFSFHDVFSMRSSHLDEGNLRHMKRRHEAIKFTSLKTILRLKLANDGATNKTEGEIPTNLVVISFCFSSHSCDAV